MIKESPSGKRFDYLGLAKSNHAPLKFYQMKEYGTTPSKIWQSQRYEKGTEFYKKYISMREVIEENGTCKIKGPQGFRERIKIAGGISNH